MKSATGYGVGETRVITIQINYKNTNAVTTYQPGDLEISIPNLSYETHENNSESAYWTTDIQVGANDSTHTNYKWNFTTGNSPTTSQETYTFTNAITFEEKSNFEGSIQIVYTITPKQEYKNTYSNTNIWSKGTYIEKYEDECIHTHSISLKASLKDITMSDAINFNYARTYTHPWKYKQYTLTKTASKISSYDNLGDNPDSYIWVKYSFSYSRYDDSVYPNIEAKEIYIKDGSIPDDCILYDAKGNKISKTNDYYKIPTKSISASWAGPNILSRSMRGTIYVGFPKSIYDNSLDNMTINNIAYLYGTYDNKDKEELLASDSETINLADFIFNYSGELYGINKSGSSALRYQDIIKDSGNYNLASFGIKPSARWTGSLMTLKIGDDILYATDQNGHYTKLTDDDYYIKEIRIGKDSDYWENANGESITSGKYDCELWIRRAGNQNYELISSFKNGQYVNDEYGSGSGTINKYKFSPEDKVVAYYMIIKDMKESLASNNIISSTIRFKKESIPEQGLLVNFAYLQVYLKDSDGNLILQNEPTEDSYASFVSKDIAKFDKDTYGHYLQRSSGTVSWSYYSAKLSPTLTGIKSANQITQDASEEIFSGSFDIGIKFSGDDYYEIYEDQYDETQTIKKIYLYDILPAGLDLTSSQNDILNSIIINKKNEFRHLDKTIVLDDEFNNIIKENAKIIVTPNYLNSGRTKIEILIDLTNSPLFICDSSSSKRTEIVFTYNYQISYDSYLEYGNTYLNYLYIYGLKGDGSTSDYFQSTRVNDDGSVDNIAYDINQNGKTDEQLAYVKSEIVITSVVSTHQDVQTQVQTANNNYTVGKGTSPYGENYTYKLRVRTGQNAATNMVIANNLEMAFNNKKYWQGEFLGVDTSYVENKTFYVYDPSNPNADDEGNVAEKVKVKVYYSENPEETNLYLTEMTQVIEDGNEVSKEVFITDGDGNILKNTNWKEYTDDVDKSSVKSLAFELLNAETGEPAVIPANSLVYVLVTMKAPEDPYLNEDVNEEDRPLANDIKTFAYNSCWTQWTAIDSFGQEVDFVTGINSNTVKVALPYSVDTNELPTVTLKFIKEISGTDSDFENMLLDKAEERNFKITLTSLTANEDGSYNQITGLLSSTQGLTLSKVPIGTYLITESDDIYFDFVEMIPNNDSPTIEGVTLEKTDKGYVLTISDDLSGDVEFNIKVTNKIEPDRPYEDKEEIENLFKIPSVDA